MLFRFGRHAKGMLKFPEKGSIVEWNSVMEERLIRLQGAGEKCFVTDGFFPEHANYAGLSLLHFIERGRSAYRHLAEAIPGVSVYEHINTHFVQVVDVLQKLGELSGVCRPIDLIHACELLQQEGSHHGWALIKNKTTAFPVSTASTAIH